MTITGVELIGKVIGLLRDVVLAFFLGTSRQLDIFLIGVAAPSVVYSFFKNGIEQLLVPFFAKAEGARTGASVSKAVWGSFTLIGVMSVGLTVVGVLTVPLWIPAFGPGLTSAETAEATRMARTMFPMLIFLCLTSWGVSYLYHRRHFLSPTLTNSSNNLGVILVLVLLADALGVDALVLGTLLAAVLQFAVLLPALGRHLPKASAEAFSLSAIGPDLGRYASPIVLASAMLQLNTIVDRAVGSVLDGGSIAALYFAERILLVFRRIAGQPIVTVVYPEMAQAATDGVGEGSFDLARVGLGMIAFTTLPMVMLLLVLGQPVVQLLLERGAFGPSETAMTSAALVSYAFSVPFVLGRDLLIRFCYSRNETRLPLRNTVVVVLLNVGLSIYLAGFLGIAGVALASSLAFASGFVLICLAMRDEFRATVSGLGADILAILAALLLAGGLLALVEAHLVWLGRPILVKWFYLGLLTIGSCAMYVGLAHVLGASQTRRLLGLFRSWRGSAEG